MRVAIFSDSYLPSKSGIVTVILQLKDVLERLGHEVFLVTVETTDEYVTNDDHILRLKSVPLGMGTDQFRARTSVHLVKEYLKDKKIDIIHCHTEFPVGKTAYRVARELGIPCVCTIHTMWVDFYKYYLPMADLIPAKVVDTYMRRFYGKFSALIGVSSKARNYYKTDRMLPEKPSVVIPNSIDKEKFAGKKLSEQERVEIRKSFGLSDDDSLMLFVGRIGEEKRVMELLEICQKVLKKCNNCKVVFIGNGPAYEDMVKKAEKEIQEKKIFFTGFMDWTELYKYYESSDIFITASLSEMHSMTILEAQLCGLPIVARNDESYLDSVFPNQNGYLPDTDDEMANNLVELVNDSQKRKDFGKRSLEITKNFSLECNVKKTVLFYEEVIKTYPNPVDENVVLQRFKDEGLD